MLQPAEQARCVIGCRLVSVVCWVITLLPAFRCDSATAATGCRSCVLSRLDGNLLLGRKLVETLHFVAARQTVIIHRAMTGGITI